MSDQTEPFQVLQLASKSPRRAELLAQIGIPFKVITVHVDESRGDSEPVHDFVVRLAENKAQAGYQEHPGLPTLGSDTVVYCQNEVFGKPVNKSDAMRMLEMMSGNWHEVLTAVAVFDGQRMLSKLACSKVHFRDLSPSECEAYWHTGEAKDKAGAYGIQGYAAVFVEELKGSYSTVMGLPLFETAALVSEFGVPIWKS